MTDFFRNKTPDFARLTQYGFERQDDVWRYRVPILDGEFDLTVFIKGGGQVTTELIEREFGEPYTLHLVETATGEFVGRVREAYEKALAAIAGSCFEASIFRQPLTYRVIEHAREKYGDAPEYLWAKFPDNAVLRRKDNQKWYAAILTVARSKVGLAGEGNVEVLDVRADPAELPLLVDGVRILPGWHMNKKHWVSVPLDGTVPFEEVSEYLEESWHLAK